MNACTATDRDIGGCKAAAYIPSAVAFFALWTHAWISSVVLYAFLGLFSGMMLCVFSRRKIRQSLPIMLLASVLSVFFLISAAQIFQAAWIDFPPLTDRIARLTPDVSDGLTMLSCALSILAFPFAERISAALLLFLQRVFSGLRYPTLRKEILTCPSACGHGWTMLGMAGNLLGAAAFGTLLLCLVFALPAPSVSNMERSASVLEKEGLYPRLSDFCTSQLDNYTDAILLGTAADDTSSGLLDRAMTAYSGQIAGLNPAKGLVSHYRDGVSYDHISGYPRYWHGYLIFLRSLLSVTDYTSLRVCNGICQLFLLLLICLLLGRRGLGNMVFPFAIAYLMLMPAALAMSFQFSPCFYVFSFGTLALLLLPEDRVKTTAVFVFLNIGIAATFFDLLTYPMATFGVPAVFLLLLCRGDSTEKKFAVLIRNGVAWCLGYAGMWTMKLLLASAVTGQNVMADGLGAVGLRISSSDGGEHLSALSCVFDNVEAFLTTPVTVLAFAFLLFTLLRSGEKKALLSESSALFFFPYFLLCLAPFAWYLCTVNHSTIHSWFTNKACVVAFLSLSAAVTEQQRN